VTSNSTDAPAGFPVVGIGASAGGLKALSSFFKSVEADSGMAYVVIVHLAEDHESLLPELLQSVAKLQVSQVTNSVKLEPDHVYVIPPTKNLMLVDGEIHLTERPKERGRRVPIDLFFRTLADAYQRDAVAVILSGAGTDGTLGLQRVKEQGGITLAQDPEEAEFDSMPRNAILTGMVDVVLPAGQIPGKIQAMRHLAEVLNVHGAGDSEAEERDDSEAQGLAEVLAIVRQRTGHDFQTYKRPTLLRRLARRMQVNEIREMADYVKLLRAQPAEVARLKQEMLITVTSFFRDREAFDYVEKHVVPKLFEGKTGNDSVRIWCCACGTGEEAYSLGMLLVEYAAGLDDPPRLQIFASDINEEAIRFARACSYPVSIATDIPAERLQRFFVRKGDVFVANKELRDMVLFTPHNVLRDPPFSLLDLISCRNLLIYLNRETQMRVMELFSFAMRPGGYLFLGSSESMEHGEGLFAPVDKKLRIYKCISNARRRHIPGVGEFGRWEAKLPGAPGARPVPALSFASLHHQVAERYAPPSVLVNEDYRVLHMSERVGKFLHFAGGEPTRNLLEIVHPALRLDVRAALMAARQDNRETEVRNIHFEEVDSTRVLNLTVRPVEVPDTSALCFLIVFDVERALVEEPKSVIESIGGDAALEALVRRLEGELRQTRERLSLTVEHGEISTEELKASNEELQAINEELRSATEELETSKEELQSVNEELTTVNNELKEKVNELSDVNTDLQNLMHSTDIGTIFLDRNLAIKRYTRRVEKLFNIISTDVGRPFEHLTHKFDYQGLQADAAEVLRTLEVVERELRVRLQGTWYLARLSPYRTQDDQVAGVVISFVEITELKRATDSLRERDFLLRLAQDAAKAGVWTLDLQDGTAWWSDECFLLHEQKPGSVALTAENWINGMHPQDADQVRKNLAAAVENHAKYVYELKLESPAGERWILEVGRAVYDPAGQAERIAGISLDITERVNWQRQQSELLQRREVDERSLREADRRKNEFLATLAHELRNPLAPIRTGLEVLHTVAASDQVKATTAVIERQVDQIVHLVDDLLDLTRVAEGKIRLQKRRMAISEAVTIAMEAVAPLMRTAHHEVTVSLPESRLWVRADLTRICQVLLNLLNNAAKFTAAGGHIKLAVEREEDMAVIRVEDDGVGICPEMLPQIFDIFYQADTSDDDQGRGLGIGLSLVKQLVALHGGSVSAHSEGRGRGTEFQVRLPLDEEEGPDVPVVPEPASAPEATKLIHKVMVVDDNQDAADLLKILLDAEHEVEVVYSGSAALELAGRFHPEAVLLDLGLPDMSGLEVAVALRKLLPDLRLIAVSGWGQPEDRRRTAEAGFDHHLVKPVQIEEIQKLLGG